MTNVCVTLTQVQDIHTSTDVTCQRPTMLRDHVTNVCVTLTQTHHVTRTLNAVAKPSSPFLLTPFFVFSTDPQRCGDYLSRTLPNHIPASGPENENENENEKEKENENERERERERADMRQGERLRGRGERERESRREE